jgi:hypothetical protein
MKKASFELSENSEIEFVKQFDLEKDKKDHDFGLSKNLN